jgi:hypothetical protein
MSLKLHGALIELRRYVIIITWSGDLNEGGMSSLLDGNVMNM